MIKQLVVAIGAILILAVGIPSDVRCTTLNPYAPMNAVAAEPFEPYNLWEIPQCSVPYYLPCPTCGPAAAGLPDVYPVPRTIKGFLWLPVPVP
jgi:hypothetical protein